MQTIIGVRLKKIGKIYYFDPGDNELNVRRFRNCRNITW